MKNPACNDPAYVKEDQCPVCRYKMDCATPVNEGSAKPHPGCFSVCINCGAILRFDQHLNLYKPTMEEIDKSASKQDKKLLYHAQAYIRARGAIISSPSNPTNN